MNSKEVFKMVEATLVCGDDSWVKRLETIKKDLEVLEILKRMIKFGDIEFNVLLDLSAEAGNEDCKKVKEWLNEKDT